jgi:F-type H+-transporting ATPase subunit b
MIAPPNLSLLLIMACFWLVYALVRTQFVTPLGKVLDERERRIREGRDTLATAQERVSAALASCERELATAASEASKQRTALRAEGETVRRARLEQARAQATERLLALAQDLDEAARAARGELRKGAETLARELAERLMGRRLAS